MKRKEEKKKCKDSLYAQWIAFKTGSSELSSGVYISIADLNGDGKPDLATSGICCNSNTAVSVLRNNGVPGMISFSNEKTYVTGFNITIVPNVIGDIVVKKV